MPKQNILTRSKKKKALALFQANRLIEARRLFEDICAADRSDAEAWQLLGAVRGMLGDYAAAESGLRQALRLQPSPEAHYHLGNTLMAQGRQADAEVALRAALRLKPDYHEALNNLGTVLHKQGRSEEAIESLRRALRLKPDYAAALVNLGVVLFLQERSEEALESLRQALRLNPDSAVACLNLGNVYAKSGQLGEAIASYREAVRIKPDFAEAHSNLGLFLARQGRLDEAIAHSREAVRIKPDFAEAHSNLGSALDNQGDAKEALASHRRALALKPDFVDAHSSILFMLHFQPDHDPAAAAAEYKNWNRVQAEPFKALIKPHRNDRTPERRLRVGYVSNDFREHVTNYFFEPVLAAHDAENFEIFCYDSNVQPDAVTARLRSHASQWRSIVGMSDAQVAELIHKDTIDILVDLKGHTDRHRLLVFAQKPAPLQVTWLGYPNTTGLGTMDFWITDRHIAAEAMSAQYHSEKLLRLPDFYMCFQPKPGAPEVGELPAMKNGHITFGSFNALTKINHEVISAWADLLKAVPGSRLMMAAVPEGKAQASVRERFARAGIGSERLILKPRVAHDEFLSLHREVDIVLDTFPCNGTTTSLHDLWMGLPVVALAGKSHAARVGASILTNLGLPELIAHTPADYVRIARDLAADTPRLSALRADLRERLRASPLMDAARFTRNLEDAYREIWRQWCAQH